MIPRGEWFVTFKEINAGKVFMGYNNSCDISGIGSITVKIFDGVVRTLTDVRCIPGLKRNLISVRTLSRKCYSYKGENGTLKVCKGTMVVIKDVERDGLFFMLGITYIWEKQLLLQV